MAKSKEQQNSKVTGTPSWRKRAVVIMVFDAIIIAFSFLFALFHIVVLIHPGHAVG